MANIDLGNNEKNLISRRTLINNGILTGLGLAAGIYLKEPSNILRATAKKLGFKKAGQSNPGRSNRKSRKDTYIDNFDC